MGGCGGCGSCGMGGCGGCGNVGVPLYNIDGSGPMDRDGPGGPPLDRGMVMPPPWSTDSNDRGLGRFPDHDMGNMGMGGPDRMGGFRDQFSVDNGMDRSFARFPDRGMPGNGDMDRMPVPEYKDFNQMGAFNPSPLQPDNGGMGMTRAMPMPSHMPPQQPSYQQNMSYQGAPSPGMGQIGMGMGPNEGVPSPGMTQIGMGMAPSEAPLQPPPMPPPHPPPQAPTGVCQGGCPDNMWNPSPDQQQQGMPQGIPQPPQQQPPQQPPPQQGSRGMPDMAPGPIGRPAGAGRGTSQDQVFLMAGNLVGQYGGNSGIW
eukprot:TRINITY_DN3227_c0_g3_i1.p2 TRINITY_DN3227_c0_g3~~TRINITY_DN3227_c0_g3_i1.p2  ORF type:complete len:313 (-),score=62.50 TRINITY_DN3227_c0_g3_i1:345-1283(-)